MKWHAGEGGGGKLVSGDEKRLKCCGFHSVACRLCCERKCQSGLVTRGQQKQHDQDLILVGGLFPCKTFHSGQWGRLLPPLISPSPRVIHSVLFRAGWAERQAHLFASFYYISGDSGEAIEVMTLVLHLGNHFHIPQKRAIMIAFDNQQSKLHHPPRVLLCGILRRKTERREGGGLRGRDGDSMWVGAWMDGWGIGERELSEGGGRRWRCQGFCFH